MQVPNIVSNLSKFLTNNSPQVLTAVGVAGVISTAILTGKASFRAADILRTDDPDYVLPFKTKVKLVWTLYIPPLSVAAVTVTSIILANKIGAQRAAAVATALKISQETFKEYRTKVVEKVGEKKERAYSDELAEERAKRVDIPQSIIVPSAAKQRVFDQYSKRWFENTVNGLERAAININHNMIHHDAASLNDFYAEVGLDPVPYGERIGWDAMEKLELIITSFLAEDGVPSVSVDFYTHPKDGYSSLH